MSQASNLPKSPFILMSTLGILVIATLVVATTYFLRPQIEIELEIRLAQGFTKAGLVSNLITVSGRDVTLSGAVPNLAISLKAEKIAKKIRGVRQVNNRLLIKN